MEKKNGIYKVDCTLREIDKYRDQLLAVQDKFSVWVEGD